MDCHSERSEESWPFMYSRFLSEPVLSERFLVTSLLEMTESEGVETTFLLLYIFTPLCADLLAQTFLFSVPCGELNYYRYSMRTFIFFLKFAKFAFCDILVGELGGNVFGVKRSPRV